MSEPHAVAYQALRGRVTEVVEAADAGALLDGRRPRRPSGAAHDVLAHLVGVPDDVVNGRLDGIASDAWTQAQVDARADASTAELLAEWDEYGPQFEALLAAGPAEIAGQALFDAAHARARPAPRARCARRPRQRRDRRGLGVDRRRAYARRRARALLRRPRPASRCRAPAMSVARIEATRFELFRAVAGRRTADEVASYGWDRSPTRSCCSAATSSRSERSRSGNSDSGHIFPRVFGGLSVSPVS